MVRSVIAFALSLSVVFSSASFAQTEINQPNVIPAPPIAPVSVPPSGVLKTTETMAAPVPASTAVPAGPAAPAKKKSSCLTTALGIGAAALGGLLLMGPVLNATDGGAAAAKDNAPVTGDIKSLSPAQQECRANAPAKPSRIIIGFDGLGAANTFGKPLLNNMIMPATKAAPNVVHQYYSQASVDSNTLSDSVRCAYEWATKPYKTKDGKTVYSTLTIMGYSYGGHAASQLADNLKKLGVTTDLMITADPREKWAIGSGRFDKTDYINKWVNIYEKLDIMGLAGATVNGGENVNVTGKAFHGTITRTDAMQNAIQTNMSQMPRCRISYGGGFRYGTAAECNNF